mmetsp:Transcript_110496/g.321637  ORF Transcript_110496/g.321637 Transcript_110496/m.321637 type:complete len:114 (-) Transcript_110496:97-438(-)
MANTAITKIGVHALTICDSLSELDVSNIDDLDDPQLIHLAQHCTRLEVLKIANAGEVTDEGIASLRDLEHLHSVDVTNCHNVTFDGLMGLKWCRGRDNQVVIASSFMSRLFEH